MRKIEGDEPACIVATISKPAFGRDTCFVGWTTTDMQGSDPGRIGEGYAAKEPRHTLCSCARFPSIGTIGALFRACHRHAQHDRTLLEMAQLMTSAITAVPRDLLDPRSVGDAEIPRCPAIGFHQGSERLFDLALAAPLCLSACDGVPTLGRPTTAV
jgi:hypothetical protein